MIFYVADAHAHMLISVVKMATVLEDFYYRKQRSLVRFFFVGKRLNAKDIHEDMLTVRSVCRVKRFRTG
jgi:hypothetical protein